MCTNCYPWIDDLPEFVLVMLLQLVTSSLLSCAVHVVLLEGVHPPLFPCHLPGRIVYSERCYRLEF